MLRTLVPILAVVAVGFAPNGMAPVSPVVGRGAGGSVNALSVELFAAIPVIVVVINELRVKVRWEGWCRGAA